MPPPFSPAQRLDAALSERFGAAPAINPDLPGLDELVRMAEHRSHRKFASRPVDPALLRLLLACAGRLPGALRWISSVQTNAKPALTAGRVSLN